MITFYRTQPCSFCDEIASKLEALVVAHQILPLSAEETRDGTTPFIQEGRHIFRTESEIRRFIERLEKEVATSRAMQSDSCVIGPDGACL